MKPRLVLVLAISLALGLCGSEAAQAHPMGIFAICHYARFRMEKEKIALCYILDFAEIPTVAERGKLDRDGDGVISAPEEQAYLAAQAPRLLAGLTLRINDHPASLQQTGGTMALSPGAGGLETLRIRLDLVAPLPPAEAPYRVVYRDRNYEDRTGWKEILAVGGAAMAIRDSSVPAADRSQELTAYPPDLIPPQDTEAQFTAVVDPKARGEASAASADSGDSGAAGSSTPRDAFTQLIAYRELGPGRGDRLADRARVWSVARAVAGTR